jgi:hypothetical protein
MHVALAPITREQVAGYLGREVPDGDRYGLRDDATYQILRPAAELAKAVSSANGLPILREHVVTSADEHPRDLTIGSTMNNAVWDEPFVRVSLTFWDGDAIADIESGAVEQISAGYRYIFDTSPGVFHGQRYSGVMRDVAFNHIIVCEKGRAGPSVMVPPDHAEETFRRHFVDAA